jgi:hypothetical protein
MRGPLCTACPAHTDWRQLTHLTASQCCHTEQVTGSFSWNRGPNTCNTAVCLAHNDGTLRCRTRTAIRSPGVGMARRTRRSGGRRAGAKRSSPPSGQHFNALPRPWAPACQGRNDEAYRRMLLSDEAGCAMRLCGATNARVCIMCALQHPVPDGRPGGRGVRCAPRDDLRQPGAQIHSLASGSPKLHTPGLRRKDIELCLDRGCSLLQCNGRGECSRGFCACHAGWYGHDCAQRRPNTPDSPGGPQLTN